MTVNEDLLDAAIRHAVRLERLKAGEVRKILAQLNRETYPKILAEIAKLEAVGVEDWDGIIRANNPEYRKIMERVDRILHDGIRAAGKTLQIDLTELAGVEVGWQLQVLRNTLPAINVTLEAPAPAVLDALVKRRPFQGRLLKDWYDSLETSTRAKVRSTVGRGIAEGRSVPDMVRDLRGRKGVPGILDQSRREVEGVVRTATNHVTTGAKQATYERNTDVVKGVLWVSTLDRRTTPLCVSLDGREFRVDEGPRPPAHFHCRSTVVPITKSFRELGIDLDELPEGTRASMDGQVPVKTTYGDWLKRQPVAIQNEVLGKHRAEWFRSGRISVDKFTDDRQRVLTVEELRGLYGL